MLAPVRKQVWGERARPESPWTGGRVGCDGTPEVGRSRGGRIGELVAAGERPLAAARRCERDDGAAVLGMRAWALEGGLGSESCRSKCTCLGAATGLPGVLEV